MGKRKAYSFEKSQARLGVLLILPALIIIAAIILYPLLYTLILSFFSKDLMNPLKGTKFIGIKNFVTLFNSPDFLTALKNTFVLTFGSLLIQLFLGMTIALLSNIEFKGRSIIRAFFILPWATPTFVAAFALIWVFDGQYGAVNHLLKAIGLIKEGIPWFGSVNTSMISLIIATAWKGMPYVILVLLAGLQMVSKDLLEAAKIDGASFRHEFIHIIVPEIMDILIITIVLRTIWTFNWFDLTYLLTGGGPANTTMTLPLQVYDTAFKSYKMGLSSAIGTAMFIILVLCSAVYFKVLKKGDR